MTEIRETMHATAIEKIGRPRVLKYVKRPRPRPARGEVLVKIHAASVSHSDLLYRSGRFIIRKPMPHILGGDFVGEVARTAAGVNGWRQGERVAAAFAGLGRDCDGSYAEYCALPAEQLIRLPAELAYPTAAAGFAFAEAWQALNRPAKLLQATDRLVICGAASDIGIAAVQIAHRIGSRVIAISPREYAAPLRELGAAVILDASSCDLVRQVKVATDEQGADIVLHCDASGGYDSALDMLCEGGRLILAQPPHEKNARLNALDIYLKNLSIAGAYDRPTPQHFEAVPIFDRLQKGLYEAVIDEVLPLSKARQAHQKLERNPGFGRIVLVPDSILDAERKPANWIPID